MSPIFRVDRFRFGKAVINSGPKNHYGLDRIPVCTGSGMHGMRKLRCIIIDYGEYNFFLIFSTFLDAKSF